MAVPNYLVAVTELGGIVKRAAVRSGGKSFLAAKAGVSVEDIEFITKGEAYRVDRATMLKVAGSCPGVYDVLRNLIDKTHPDRDTGNTVLFDSRIRNPLTNAERRPQMA